MTTQESDNGIENKLRNWAVGAAIGMVVSGLGAITTFSHLVFSRSEGTAIEQRLTRTEQRLDEKLDKLGELSGKLDAIILYLGKESKDERPRH